MSPSQETSSSSLGPHGPTAARAQRLAAWLRAALLIAVAGAAVVALESRRPGSSEGAKTTTRYTCPMHPEVASTQPGDCPLCHMELVPVAAAPPSSARATSEPLAQRPALAVAQPVMMDREIVAPASVDDAGAVTAVLRADELRGLEPGTRATFAPTTHPETSVRVRSAAAPPRQRDDSTAWVRFEVEDAAPRPAAGTAGWVRFVPRLWPAVVVPSRAVVPAPGGPYVLEASTDGRDVVPWPVKVGVSAGGFTSIVDGVSERDVVVGRGTFAIEAERRLVEASAGARRP